jgi:hypothetical protein
MNWLWLGNPFSPFFNKFFPNPYVHVSLEEEWTQYLRNYREIKTPWQIPLEVTVKGSALCGLLGPAFLLAPLALLALRWREGRRLLAAALIFGCTYPLNIGTRFLIPPLPFLSLSLAMVITRARATAPLLLAFHALTCWPTNAAIYSDRHAWRLEKPLPWKQAFRIDDEEGFLTRTMPYYIIARMIEAFVPPGEPVFVFNQVAEAYTNRDILVGYQAAFNHTMGDTLWTAIVDDYHPRRHVSFRFPRQPLSALRVVQTAGGSGDHWAVNEVYVLNEQTEVARTAAWRLLASPNPWDVEMAFDRNLATRWRSWQTLVPGMFLEADFGKMETVDSARIECALGQYDPRMKLEGRTPSGEWKILDAKPQQIVVDDPPGLRRAAVAALLERGVKWVLLDDTDLGAADLRDNAAEWGITPVANRITSRLYKLY